MALEVGEPESDLDLEAAGDALAEAAAAASAAAEEVEDEPVAPAVLVPPAPRRTPPPAAPVRPAARPAAAKPEPPKARREEPAEAEADLSDELEEAGFFAQQGLVDDARAALQTLLEFYPGHSGVLAKLAEIERRAASAETAGPASRRRPEAASTPAGGDEGFDIARGLAEELVGAPSSSSADDEFQYSVEDVFSQFKKGVEATVNKEDSATHYDLGIAYREMGLLDDALHEFETALGGNDRRREVDCLTMIALCRMAREEPKEAIQAYRRALGSEFLTKDSAKAIHYDLSSAYDAAGQPEVALHYLQKVARSDPGYRDAAARVKALGGGPGRPPPEGEARTAAAAAAPRPVNGTASAARPAPRPAAPRPAVAPPAAIPPPGSKKNIGYL